MSVTVLGATTMQLVSQTDGVTRRNGPTRFLRYEGSRTAAEAFYEDCIALVPSTYDDVQKVEQAGKGVVTISIVNPDSSTTEEDLAEWEVSENKVWKPLLQLPYFAQSSGTFWDEIPIVDKAIETGSGQPDNLGEWGKRYWALRSSGVEGAEVSQPVIRKTITVSARRLVDVAMEAANVNDCVDVADIVAAGLPTEINGMLSSMTKRVYAGNGDPADYTTPPGTWEFVKRMPTKQSAGKGMWRISYTWEAAEKYSTVIYGKLATWDPTGT